MKVGSPDVFKLVNLGIYLYYILIRNKKHTIENGHRAEVEHPY